MLQNFNIKNNEGSANYVKIVCVNIERGREMYDLVFVDNNFHMLELMKDYFFDYMGETFFFNNADDAKKHIHKHQNSEKKIILIADYHMPDENGIELCRNIKDFDGDIIKILCSVNIDEGILKSAINDNIVNYFVEKDSRGVMENLNMLIEKVHLQNAV